MRCPTASATVGLFAAALTWSGPAVAQPAEPPVDVAIPLQTEVIDYDVYTGRFEAVERVEIVARVSGYLDRVHFDDGALVEAGDPLFTIDQRTFKAAVARAEAQVASALATRELAEIELARAVQLAERNVGTAQEVDRTQAALAEADAAVKVAEAELLQARLDLDFTEIRAPISGRMSDAKIDEGNLVIGGTGGATLLSSIVSVDPVHFEFSASEADFLRYSRLAGSGEARTATAMTLEVAVQLMDEGGFNHPGTMNFVDNQIDPNSGTITGRAVIPNPDGIVVPGLFGRVRLPGSPEYAALLVPDAAILADQAKRIVMVVGEDRTVSARPIVTGPLWQGFRVIREGLSAEDRVVVNGVQRARPGAKVTPNRVELQLGGN
ncbi:MAG: efflux RND transporter periplasmic adaptor subunit [Pikeienuella sp.]